MTSYLKQSKSKQRLLVIREQINIEGITEQERKSFLEFIDILRIRKRTIARQNFILDILAKALIENDDEYQKCKRKFRRTSLWIDLCKTIEVIEIHRYRFYIKGLEVLKERPDVIHSFFSLIEQAFNRAVSYKKQSIREEIGTLVIYKPEYGIPIIKTAQSQPVKV